MPFVTREHPRPEPWAQRRNSTSHPIVVPFLFTDWCFKWTAYILSRWTFLEVLEYLSSFSILVVVIFYFAESGKRVQMRHYQAWQVIDAAQGKGGSGGRIEALSELNADGVPLVGVDVSGAFLQEVKLDGADLLRGDLHAADLRDAHLARANLDVADLHSANLRQADLTRANLSESDLRDADLQGVTLAGANLSKAMLEHADLRNADLAGISNWMSIDGIAVANINGVRNAPDGFIAWATKQGAVQMADDAAWEKALRADAMKGN